MKLENGFTIDVSLPQAWEALNNPNLIAPCFPGATLTKYEGDRFDGSVKVKLGPISMKYSGTGAYVERDRDGDRVVIEASGRATQSSSTANATVTISLTSVAAERTSVAMVTDLALTGRPAQFGRGVVVDVADRIIGQFASCVAEKLAATPPGSSAEPVAEPHGISPARVPETAVRDEDSGTPTKAQGEMDILSLGGSAIVGAGARVARGLSVGAWVTVLLVVAAYLLGRRVAR
ncbi:SRPBCC family protein [Pseudonocardia xishanensis]|uniref:SRPBCC family protein n=1 Tax=Pseudonocardia xishanensis TaxID=630995 RepID=A0ABP8RW75_9PSEU